MNGADIDVRPPTDYPLPKTSISPKTGSQNFVGSIDGNLEISFDASPRWVDLPDNGRLTIKVPDWYG